MPVTTAYRSSLEALQCAARQIRPDDPQLAGWCADYWRHHEARFRLDCELARRFAPKGARLLEVGAIPCFLTAALSGDYRIVGVDIDPTRFRRSIVELGLDVRRCDVETEPLPFEDGEFECVIFNEVFEHLRLNPVMTMREVRRVLASGGVLMLSTPNLRSLYGILNLVLRGRAHAIGADPQTEFSKLERLGHMGHVREYTSAEVAGVLEAAGFQVERVVYRGGSRWPERIVGNVVPASRPFMSMICRAA